MKTKQAKQILYSLVMAIVMMAMCPMKVWAQGLIQVSTANELISAISYGNTANIQLTQDITFGVELSGGANKKNVTIDLNNHTLSYNGEDDYAFWYFKSLTLKNGTFTSTKAGVGKTTTLIIDNCNISAVKPCIYNDGGTCSLNNVQMTSTSSSAVYTVGGTINFNGPCRLSSGTTAPLSNINNGTINVATDYKMLDCDGTEISVFNGTVGTWGEYITAKKCCASVKIGETTTKYADIQTALSAAVSATSPATMTMLDDVDLNNELKIQNGNCELTLDLNGHKIKHTTGSYVVLLFAGSLTITDSSAEKKGEMESNYYTIDALGGSITIHGGTFTATNNDALYVGNGVQASVDGGRFKSINGNAVETSYGTTALANGYAYYNYSPERELSSTTYIIKDDNGNVAKDIIVKPASVKATLTIGNETTDYYTFMSAFNAALSSSTPTTLKMLADVDLKIVNDNNDLKIQNSNCNLTLNLNGHKINHATGSYVVLLSAGSLTITDSSAEMKGEMESNYYTVDVISGGSASITIHGGTFISHNSNALYVDNGIPASVYGGRFITNSTSYSAVYTSDFTTALADGCSYYNAITGNKLESTTYSIKDEYGNDATDVVVLNNTNVTIEDGLTFFCPIDYTVENLTFNRNIVKDGGKYSFIVPFDIPAAKAAELGKFYKYEKCEDDVVYFAEETEGVKANTGYFLDPAKNITSITVQSAEIKATTTMADAANPSAPGLYGAYKTIDIPAGAYGYGNNGVFVKAGSGNKLAAYRAYLWLGNDVNLSKATAIFRNGGGLTAIDVIENDVMNSVAPIYNLSGQRIATPKNGEIYIQNGKKVIMK